MHKYFDIKVSFQYPYSFIASYGKRFKNQVLMWEGGRVCISLTRTGPDYYQKKNFHYDHIPLNLEALTH